MPPIHFSKADVRALIILAAALLLVAVARWYFSTSRSDADIRIAQRDADSIRTFQQRLNLPHNTTRPAELFPFDPNHADSATLSRLGLAPWQIKNMMKYRSRGGKWRTPDDFARLYGLKEEDFRRLRPYIRIAPADGPHNYAHTEHYGTPKGDIPQYERIEKYPEGTTLNLNEADTTQLKRIPGIGSYYARKICQYRERLGGFVSPLQTNDIDGLPPGISRWFYVEEKSTVKQIRINRATFKQLVRHPYLNYEQTKAIANHVRNYGPLRDWRDLRLYKEFSEADFNRLSPYFRFD